MGYTQRTLKSYSVRIKHHIYGELNRAQGEQIARLFPEEAALPGTSLLEALVVSHFLKKRFIHQAKMFQRISNGSPGMWKLQNE